VVLVGFMNKILESARLCIVKSDSFNFIEPYGIKKVCYFVI
jgi:hypothetical protein